MFHGCCLARAPNSRALMINFWFSRWLGLEFLWVSVVNFHFVVLISLESMCVLQR